MYSFLLYGVLKIYLMLYFKEKHKQTYSNLKKMIFFKLLTIMFFSNIVFLPTSLLNTIHHEKNPINHI